MAAMQYEISDPAAVAFARGFYAAIVRGRGIDDAVSSGRVAILGLSDRTLEWVTPVLYLRGHDSQLFTLPAPDEDTSPESASRDDTDSSSRGQRDDTSRTTPYASAAAPPHLPVPVRVPPAHLAHTLTGHDGSVWGWRSARTGGCSPPRAATRRHGCGTRPPASTCVP